MGGAVDDVALAAQGLDVVPDGGAGDAELLGERGAGDVAALLLAKQDEELFVVGHEPSSRRIRMRRAVVVSAPTVM